MPITIRPQGFLDVHSHRLDALFHGASLLSLKNAAGRPLIERPGSGGPPGIELQFGGGSTVAIGTQDAPRIHAVRIGPDVVHLHIEDNEADACVRIAIDAGGRLLLEPSVHTLRPGLGVLRLNVAGISAGLKLVAPLYQGCSIDLESPLLAPDRYAWPHFWEAPLAVLQGAGGGWSVCCHDRLSRPKALGVGHAADARTIGLETEAFGPWDRNASAGSLGWIVDVHEGEWSVPVMEYRRWLEQAWDFPGLIASRPDWVRDIRLTLQGCPPRVDILAAASRLIDPKHVLVETGGWRRDPFDVNYPEYVPSEAGREFLGGAVARGFRVMPYFNFHGCDPAHPFYASVRDFVTRDPSSRRILGWRHDGRQCRDFPQGQERLVRLKERTGHTELAYVHPGSSVWRRELVRRIAESVREFGLSGVFVDQTLATGNVDNGLVENLSPTEGMVALTREICAIHPEMAVAGEGCNEMSMQYLAFAQAHLFKSWHSNHPHLGDLDPVPVGAILYGDVCRTMGYIDIMGGTPESAARLDLHEKLGALPSLTVRNPGDLENLSAAARRVIERAL
jgi:hypothetical protein